MDLFVAVVLITFLFFLVNHILKIWALLRIEYLETVVWLSLLKDLSSRSTTAVIYVHFENKSNSKARTENLQSL